MNSAFSHSKFSHNLGSWDLDNKSIANIFMDSLYSLEKYQEDRKNYLDNIKIEKDKMLKEENDKYIIEEIDKLNESLNKEVIISVIEMEF